MTATSLVFQNTPFDVIDRNNQPWLRLPQIEAALGYTNAGKGLYNIYKRYADEFTDSMTALVKLPDLNPQNEGAGQMRETRIFSLRGAHLLAMLSRTAVAKEFRKWVLDILDHETQTITTEQQDHLNMIVKSRGLLNPGYFVYVRDQFVSRFNVASFDQLPSARFEEAMIFLENIPTGDVVALPAFTEKLKNAINRKAQLLVLDGYDRTRDTISKLVQEWERRGWTDAKILSELETVGGSIGDLHLIQSHDLWKITSNLAVLRILTESAMNSIHSLEKQTGREWYGRMPA